MNKVTNRQVICDTLLGAAKEDQDIIVVCSDSRGSGSMTAFFEQFPAQSVEVGIAEQDLVSISAGLAACGKKMFAVSPACFLSTRSYEQAKVDVAYAETNVTLVGIFCYGSMFGIFIAFQEYELLGGVLGSEFVGLKNFIDIFTADTLGTYRYFRNTIYISLIRIGTNFPIILIYTLLVNEIKRRRIKSVVQTISFLPHFISWVVVGGLAYNLLTVNGGTLSFTHTSPVRSSPKIS